MNIIIQAIVPVFLLIGLGYITEILLKKRIEPPKFLVLLGCAENSWISALNGFALYLGLPALIFHSLVHTDRSSLLSEQVVGINLLLLVLTILLTTFFVHGLRLKKEVANAYIAAAFFGQVAYLGFPFLSSLIENSTGIVSMHVAIHVGVAFTALIAVLEYQKHGKTDLIPLLKNLIKNPLLISVLLGIIWLLFDLSVHPLIDQAIGMLAASASPVVLIAIGMFIGRKIYLGTSLTHAALITGLKIICLPLLFFIAGMFYDFGSHYDISIILAGMPVALTCFALSEIYPIDRKIIANAIIISTVASVVTLSALSFIVI